MKTIIAKHLRKTTGILTWLLLSTLTVNAQKGNPPSPLCYSNELGGEFNGTTGWFYWRGITGSHNTAGNATFSGQPINAPLAPNFNLTSGTGVDPCAVGGSSIPVVAPGFGNASVQLGEPMAGAGAAEQISVQFYVLPWDSNFMFTHAIIMQHGNHAPGEEAYVEMCITDIQGNQIPNGCFRYTASQNMQNNGFYPATCGTNTSFKPWNSGKLNLSAYLYTHLKITITNVDCSQGCCSAHSYWDFKGGPALNTGNVELKTKASFTILPTVSSSGLFSVKDYTNVQTISVYTVLGEKLFEETDEIRNNPSYQLDLSAFSSGIYFVNLKTEQGVATRKIIIQ